MIRERLISAIRQTYPEKAFTFSAPPEPIASLPGNIPQVGLLQIYDEGDEATVCFTDVTHSHFSCYETDKTQEQREEIITGDVMDFLEALFSDQVLLYRSRSKSMGGWVQLPADEPLRIEADLEYFLWSRVYNET